jgi:hypothetical protein
LNNSFSYPIVDLISACAATEQLDLAHQALADLNKAQPNFTIQGYREIFYAFSSNRQFRQELDGILDGLRKGGVAEQ